MGRSIAFACTLLLGSSALADGRAAGTVAPRPRSPLSKPATIDRPAWPSRLTLKLRDGLAVRARAGGLVSQTGAALAGPRGVAARHGLSFTPLIDLPPSVLATVEARALARSGVAQPDLAGMLVAHGPDAALEPAARELLPLDEVEWVHFAQLAPEPPCSDLPPPTPHYYAQGLQPYHGPDPGLNMAFAWSLGALGQGVRIADCEYGYIPGTEDLCGILDEPGQTIHPDTIANGWDNHGTAVFGAMIGLQNGYGVTGLVPGSSGLFFPELSVEEGSRRVTAITNAIAAVDAGDVVVLEMQAVGAGGGFGPAELDPAVWTVTKVGTDSGIVVVAAAGNGNQNLDGAPYAAYMAQGDSGAIIVGAGTADVSHTKLGFSTYGSRVDVQAWGEEVFTLGYGDYQTLGGDKRQRYTDSFGGTSSATPLVASAVGALQSLALDTHGCALDSRGVRQLLVDSGIPQGAGGHIGPFPDLQAASQAVLDLLPDCSYGCGNDHVEGSEACDGSDAAACAGPCASDCTCLAFGPGAASGLAVTDFHHPSQRMWIAWNPACAATDHALVYGPLDLVGSYAYTGQICGLGATGSHGPFQLPAGSWFFLVVGNADGIEGSYGKDGDGQERPEQTTDPACALVQDLSFPCTAAAP
jgi:hypothetical protein